MISIGGKIKRGTHVLRSVLQAPKPEEFFFLTFAITYRCNSRCTMCNIWQKYRKYPARTKDELSAQEIREAFRKSALLKQTRIFLVGGGEPFLKSDFTDIILLLNEFNPKAPILIASNGQDTAIIESKLRHTREGIVRQGNGDSVVYVGVSLDGLEETHDKVRGRKGSFRNAVKTIETIRKIDGIHTGFVFTFTPGNYREFPAVLQFAGEMKTALTFQFAQTSGHYYDNMDTYFDWTKEQIDEVRDILRKSRFFDVIRREFLEYRGSRGIGDRLLSYNDFFLKYVLEYQLHQERKFNCYSGTHSCFLDPYGDVFPCISLGKRIGNIKEENFDSLWTSPEATEVRKHISRRQCHCCSFCDIPNSLPRNLGVITSNLKNILASR